MTLSRHPSASPALRAARAGHWRIDQGRVHLDAAARRLLAIERPRLALSRWLPMLPAAAAATVREALAAGGPVSLALDGVLLSGQAADGAAQGLVLPLPAAEPRETFFASVSHELRTPLNAILGFTRMAGAELADGPARRHLAAIDASSRLMLRVVNDLLDLAQLDAGRLAIDTGGALALPALVARVGRFATALRQDKPVALYALADPACPPALRGDAVRLEQVLLNLVGNALKFTARGLVVLAVKPLASSGHEATLRFSVSDTGQGIALDRLDRLGTPFERAEAAALPQAGGSGLGLALVQRLLRLMGTRLQMASVAGGGTLAWFDLALPLDTAPPPPLVGEWALYSGDRRLQHSVATQWLAQGQRLAGPAARRWLIDTAAPGAEAEAARRLADGCSVVRTSALPEPGAEPLLLLADAVFSPPAAEAPPADPRLRGLRVLVVEDNPLNQQVLGALLVGAGLAVVVEADGAGAWARVEREHFDVALLDIQLGAESGFELARRLRARPGGDALAIVFLSAHLGAAEQQAAQALGALGCLQKPYEPAALLALLGRVPPAAPATPLPPPMLRRLFSTTWPAQRQRIAGDREALRRGVHALRGSLALLGDREALALARAVEEGLAAGRAPESLPIAALLARADAIAAG